jgi:hypothetical protein
MGVASHGTREKFSKTGIFNPFSDGEIGSVNQQLSLNPGANQTFNASVVASGILKTTPDKIKVNQQLLGGIASFNRTTRNAVVSQYDSQPMVQINATTQDTDLGTVAKEVRRVIAQTEADLPKGTKGRLFARHTCRNQTPRFGSVRLPALAYQSLTALRDWSHVAGPTSARADQAFEPLRQLLGSGTGFCGTKAGQT